MPSIGSQTEIVYKPTRISKETQTGMNTQLIVKRSKGRYGGKKNINTMKPHTMKKFIKDVQNSVLTYDASFALGHSTIQNANSSIWRANNIFDPDFSNITRNNVDSGYGLAASIYQKFRVDRVRASFVISNTSAVPVEVVLWCDSTGSPSTATYIGQYSQRDGAKSVVLGPAGSNTATRRVSKMFNIWDVLGVHKKDYQVQDNLTAMGTTGTVKPAYLMLTVGALPDGGATGCTLIVQVLIKQYAVLYDAFSNISDV